MGPYARASHVLTEKCKPGPVDRIVSTKTFWIATFLRTSVLDFCFNFFHVANFKRIFPLRRLPRIQKRSPAAYR